MIREGVASIGHVGSLLRSRDDVRNPLWKAMCPGRPKTDIVSTNRARCRVMPCLPTVGTLARASSTSDQIEAQGHGSSCRSLAGNAGTCASGGRKRAYNTDDRPTPSGGEFSKATKRGSRSRAVGNLRDGAHPDPVPAVLRRGTPSPTARLTGDRERQGRLGLRALAPRFRPGLGIRLYSPSAPQSRRTGPDGGRATNGRASRFPSRGPE